MHEQQRKFFASSDRFCIASPRRHRHYAQKQREETLRAIDASQANKFKIIAVDEFKEMTKEDHKEITDYLRDRMELQSFIQTEKSSDWFWEYSKEQSRDRQ